MSINFTLPARTLHPFQARRAGFNYQPSPLSPLSKPSSLKLAGSAESNRSHLSNLERLLQKDHLSAVHSDRNKPVPVQKGNRNILENLNLGRLWPEMKAAEDMSPRHLNRLKRLLSVSKEQYSPRNGLGGRWREYHGENDWAGLLDRLDENLRREVVRYGEFIQAAYYAFNSDPATSPSGPPLPRGVALPDKSYRVTRSLYATSSVGLPKWVDDVAPTLDWMTQRSSWIGYVAVCDDKREIQRMGRRDIIISLRGTSTCLEWAENVRAQLVPNDPAHEHSKVECGFLSLYKTRGAHVPSLSESVVTEIKRLTELYKGETLSVTVTGHSLGAALALLAANDITTRVPNAPPVAVFSFGGPRVGNKAFADAIKQNNVKVLRIVNSQDVITRVPAVLGAYSHVGTELRVDTKTSPYLKPNADVACCHDLEAYLHLVDGFMGRDCPFRENAKRSLVKLVHEQGSNVKKLYTSKAKNLSNLNLQREGIHVSPACLPSPS